MLEIRTNYRRREVLDAWQLTTAERAQFDYLLYLPSWTRPTSSRRASLPLSGSGSTGRPWWRE